MLGKGIPNNYIAYGNLNIQGYLETALWGLHKDLEIPDMRSGPKHANPSFDPDIGFGVESFRSRVYASGLS